MSTIRHRTVFLHSRPRSIHICMSSASYSARSMHDCCKMLLPSRKLNCCSSLFPPCPAGAHHNRMRADKRLNHSCKTARLQPCLKGSPGACAGATLQGRPPSCPLCFSSSRWLIPLRLLSKGPSYLRLRSSCKYLSAPRGKALELSLGVVLPQKHGQHATQPAQAPVQASDAPWITQGLKRHSIAAHLP